MTLFVKQEQGEIEQERKSQARLSVLEARAGGNRASFQRRGGSTNLLCFDTRCSGAGRGEKQKERKLVAELQRK